MSKETQFLAETGFFRIYFLHSLLVHTQASQVNAIKFLESIRGFSFFFKKTKTSNPLDLEVFDSKRYNPNLKVWTPRLNLMAVRRVR